jgi:hypothetical protein
MEMRVHRSVWVTLALVLVSISLPASAQCNSNDSGAPCFTNVQDILNGRGSLLQDDDLAVNSISSSNTTMGANLLTSNSQIETNQITPTNITNQQIISNNVLGIRGRLFNVDHDQILSAASLSNASGIATLEGSQDSAIKVPALSVLNVSLPPNATYAQTLLGASGDFLGIGYDQMLVVGQQLSTGNVFMQALGASNPQDTSSGLVVGSLVGPVASTFNQTQFVLYALGVTAGVFMDPQPGTPRPNAQLATVYSTDGQSLTVTFYGIDSNLNVSATGTSLKLNLNLGSGYSVYPFSIAIAAGRFNGGTHDQLAVLYAPYNLDSGASPQVMVTTVDFNGGTPLQQTTTNTGFTLNPTGGPALFPSLYAVKGKFNWFSDSDQLALSVSNNGSNGTSIGVMSFDASLIGTMGTPFTQPAPSCHAGLAVGRFDNQTANGQINPNLQLADISTSCSNSGLVYANIYNVGQDQTNPNIFVIETQLASQTNISSYIGQPYGSLQTPVTLTAGDEQGRSLALGPPEKVSVAGHSQADNVLEVPPMHVDWISQQSGPLQITNFSVYPLSYNAQYSFSGATGNEISSSDTTSYSFTSKRTTSEGVSYGVPGASINATATQAATDMHRNNVATKYNTYSGASTGFSSQTRLDDQVATTGDQINVYTYPVIGQCFTLNPCDPVYVQFSGPDNVNYGQATGGSNLEWYQPVQEPGNIFSYPATLAQLANNLPTGITFQPLSATDIYWDPQQSSTSSTNWFNQGTNSVTAGSTNTHSFDTSLSVSGGVNFDGVGATAKLGFDYNDSSSISTHNTGIVTLASSTGVTVTTGTPANSNLPIETDYQGQTVIFGQTNPNVVQTDASPSTTVQAHGSITVAQLADMMSQSSTSGGIQSATYWVQAYTAAPDIALNHPVRWNQTPPSGVNGQTVTFNCPFGYSASPGLPCVTSNSDTDPLTGYASASFYTMKGLFITPGNTFNGPQIASTTLGSAVNLKARVYNYSLSNYPTGSTLHVQFYAQPYDTEKGQFLAGTNADGFAPAIFIGNGTTESGGTSVPPPPAFCGGPPTTNVDPCTVSPGNITNNWEYVYASWNTGNGGVTANSTWKFWVVTWVQDSDGNLVSELPGHGLTALPTGAAYNSLADVPIELYSNNLGLYEQAFTVFPTTSTSSQAASTPVSKQLRVGKISTRNNAPVLRHSYTTILAPHIALGDHIDTIHTYYYDGDPAKPGSLFDIQRIPRVIPGSIYIDTVNFRSETCGPHTILVRSVPMDGSAAATTSIATFRVTDDPIASIDDLIEYINRPSYPPRFRHAILSYLNAAKRSFTKKQIQAGTIQMQTLLNLVQGGAFFVPADVQQTLANQMSDLLGCL